MEEVKTQEAIHAKGFDMVNGPATEYNKLKIGLKTVQDAVLELGTYQDGFKESQKSNQDYSSLAKWREP